MLYSLGDFQLALSAYDFLLECDPDKTYSTKELRRFRCFETTMVIAYSRPFTATKGNSPKLSLKMTGAELSQEEKALHHEIIESRNTVMAHSDHEFMRMAVETFPVEMQDNRQPINMFVANYDEGLSFIGKKLLAVGELLHKLHGSLHRSLIHQSHDDPDKLNIRINADQPL